MREFCEFARRKRGCPTKPGPRPTTRRHAGSSRQHRCRKRIGWKSKHARVGIIRCFVTDAFMADDSEPRTNVSSDFERVEGPVTDDEHSHGRLGTRGRAELISDTRHAADMSGSGTLRRRALGHHQHEEVHR
jgi:hypothetical protein